MTLKTYNLPELLSGKKTRERALRAIGPTVAAEVELRSAMKEIIKKAAIFTRDNGLPEVESAQEQMKVKDEKPTIHDSFVLDSVSGIQWYASRLRGYLLRLVAEAEPKVRSAIRKEEVRHRRGFTSSIRAATGIDITPVLREADVAIHLEAAMTRSVELIRGMTSDLTNRVVFQILKGATEGTRTKDVAKDLAEQFRWSEKRAKFIARDQTATLNGTLNKIRQTQVGIEKYQWATSQDERVRPLHEQREGEVFSWDDPPSDGHPGEPINCRCVARPILEAPADIKFEIIE